MFTQATLDFLDENYQRNDREWFREHKASYRTQVLAPLAELVEALTPFLQSVDPLLVCTPKVDRTISRIYRDLRFSRSGALYRSEMWISCKRDKRFFPLYPEFYFYLSPLEFGYGCGYYEMSPEALRVAREKVLARSPKFEKLRRALEKQTVFAPQGALPKRDRFPDQPEPYKSWLNRKAWTFGCSSREFDTLFAADFAEKLERDFRLVEPLYRFLLEIEEQKTE